MISLPSRSASAIASLALCASLASPALAQTGDDGPPSEVRLPLAQYEALMARHRDRGGAHATWSTATLSARLPDAGGAFVALELEAEVQVMGQGSGLAEVALLPGHVVLEDARIDGAAATLVRTDGAHVAMIELNSGRHNVTLRYQVPTQPASDGATLAVVPLPPVPGARLSLSPGAVSTPPEVWPSGNVITPGQNLVVQLPSTPAVVMRWGSGQSLVRRVDYKLTISPGSDGATIAATIEVNLEGARAQVPLLPAAVALTDVTEGGRPLPTSVSAGWHRAVVTGPGRHVLTASFRTGIDRSQGQPQVTLPLAPAPILRVETVVPGNRAVTFEPSVPLEVTTVGEEPGGTTTAVGFLPPSEDVVISWTEPRTAPEEITSVNSETYQLVKIEEGVVRSRVEIRYEIIRGTLKELPIQLPDQAVLYKVSGDGIEDWRTFAATEDEPRQARVFLGSERDGSYRLELELEQVAPQTVGQPLEIPIVRPLGAAREMGVIALFDGDKVGFAEAVTEGYVKSGEDALPIDVRQKLAGDIVSQAFKHIGQPAAMRSQVAAAKTRETRFDAAIESLYTFQQNTLTVHSSVTIDVKSGRTDRIVLSLPRGVKVGSDVSAPSLKKADWVDAPAPAPGTPEPPRQDYEIVLTRALEGTFRIELSLEVILGSDLAKIALPDIQLADADVKKGDFGITADAGMEITQASLSGLRKLDVAELPNSVKLRSRREVQLGYSYSYVDEPWKLELDVRRHKTVETLTAQVQQAWVDTTIFEEGEVVYQATYLLENKDRPYLRLSLPEGSRLLGVTVAGERVEPIADESGALKIQLPKQQASFVEVAYMTKRDPLSLLSSVALEAPRPDVFQTDFQWRVRVPKDLNVFGVSTDLAELMPERWRPVPSEASSGAITVRLPPTEDYAERAFSLDVLDAGDAKALTIAVRTFGAPPWIGTLILVAAFALLALAIWRRASGRVARADRAFVMALGVGLALLVIKAIAWGVSGGEAVVVVVALLIVGLVAWMQHKSKEAA